MFIRRLPWEGQPPALAPENDSQAWRLLYCGAVSPASLGAESRVPTGGALPVSFSRFGQGEAFNGTSSSRGWSYSSGAPWVGMSSRPFTVAALIGLSKPASDMSNHTLIARGYGGAGIPFFVDVELSTPTYANPRLRIGTFNGSLNAIAWFDVNALTQGDALNVYGGWDGTNWVIWVNGVAGTSSSAFGPDTDNAQPIAIGSLPGLGRYWTSSITAVGLSGRPPTASGAAEFLSRPYDVLFAPRRIIIPVSAAAGGTATVTTTLIASAATFGTAVVSRTAVATATPSVIASTATFGTHTVARTAVATVTAARIESTATFGTASVARSSVAAASPARIESTETFGTATVARTAVASVTPARIESAATFGTHVIDADGLASVSPARIESTATFGTATVTTFRAVDATRIESTATFGTATVERTSAASITPGRIDSAATFGVPSVSALNQIVVGRIESTASFGTATVTRTGSGTGADAAEIWGYVLSNGDTAEANIVAIRELLTELHRIHGLELGTPLVVSATARVAGAIEQALAEASGTVTVTRQ